MVGFCLLVEHYLEGFARSLRSRLVNEWFKDSLNINILPEEKTSLLRRLQAQTLPDEAPPVGKTQPFSKIAVTFEPIQQF